MMAGVRSIGRLSLRDLKAQLRAMPKTLATDVAREAAPMLTGLAQTSFDSGRTVYNDARPTGAKGNTLTLRKSGAVRSALRFVAIGTVMRVVLGPRYARYLIGKYRILPVGDRSAIPAHWRREIERITLRLLQARRAA